MHLGLAAYDLVLAFKVAPALELELLLNILGDMSWGKCKEV